MQCYYCEKAPLPGGLRYGIREAVGVCHECGVAVCSEHGAKTAGKPLLCTECSAAQNTKLMQDRAA